MCFNNKCKYRTLHEVFLNNQNKISGKQKTNILRKIPLSSFSIFHTKSIIHVKIVLFYAALLAQNTNFFISYRK